MIQGRIFALLLAVLLAIPTLFASAQTPTASGTPAADELVGIRAAVSRSYMPAGTCVGSCTVTLEESNAVSSEASRTPLRAILVLVREFDTAEHAASAFEQISADAEASFSNVSPDGTITSEELPNIGAQATRIRLDHTVQFSDLGLENDFWSESVIVQRDQYVFFVSANASDLPMKQGSGDVDKSLPSGAIASVVAEGEPSPEEQTFSQDGTSTGRLWGFMLPAGDPLLKGLVPFHDSIVYPPTPPPGAQATPSS